MNRSTYLKQHQEIREQMDTIQRLVNENLPEKNAETIAHCVARLAGIISVHLSMEDKFMYPKLAESTDDKIKSLGTRYQKQMGSIAANFTVYKDKYNTKAEVLQGASKIKAETDKMFKEILNRIKTEEAELYQYIS